MVNIVHKYPHCRFAYKDKEDCEYHINHRHGSDDEPIEVEVLEENE